MLNSGRSGLAAGAGASAVNASAVGGGSIRIDQVSKSYVSKKVAVPALGPIDLLIDSGEFVSVVGPSGCGKSTLMLIVAGLLPSTGGSVLIDGAAVTEPVTNVGIVFQDDLLLEFRTAVDNVALQLEVRGERKANARAQAAALLAHMGLGGAESKYPNQMSGGMRQRVAIARAFIHNPALLLMDEPFGALDALSRTQMHGDLERLWLEHQSTVLFITHSVEEAVRLSDRVIVFSASPGQIVEDIRIDHPRPRPLTAQGNPELNAYAQRVYELFARLGVLRV